MAPPSFTVELTSPVPAAKLFKALVLEGHNLTPIVMPEVVKSGTFIKGDGGVGTIKEIIFTDAIPLGTIYERVDLLDKDNFECKLGLLGGVGTADEVEWGASHTKVVPAADGGSVVTIFTEYKNVGGVEQSPEELEESKQGTIGMVRAMEAYVIANPDY